MTPVFKNYDERRSFSDSHMDAVRCVLGKKFFHFSSLHQDTQLGIDLCIPELKLAVRVRQGRYAKYKDFTLRSSAKLGESEYQKIMSADCQVDFIFYAYELDKNTFLAGYLIDVPALRTAINLGEVIPKNCKNKDSSTFVAIDLKDSFAEQLL